MAECLEDVLILKELPVYTLKASGTSNLISPLCPQHSVLRNVTTDAASRPTPASASLAGAAWTVLAVSHTTAVLFGFCFFFGFLNTSSSCGHTDLLVTAEPPKICSFFFFYPQSIFFGLLPSGGVQSIYWSILKYSAKVWINRVSVGKFIKYQKRRNCNFFQH